MIFPVSKVLDANVEVSLEKVSVQYCLNPTDGGAVLYPISLRHVLNMPE